MNIAQKLEKLKKILLKMDSVLIAYSGGVDSTLLLKVAKDILNGRVLAITAKSPTYPSNEVKKARDVTEQLKVKHKIITTNELSNQKFICNPVNRCYYCKTELFSALKKLAKKHNLKFIVDGSNYDDRKDFRPGNKAKAKFGVRSPLKEAGLTKNDVRILSKKFGLSTWDKPTLSCLASRFPYGLSITKSNLEKVNKAEDFLHGLGFKQVRVRHYCNLARIEVDQKDIPQFITYRKLIIEKLKELGYTYVTVDLEGYRTGSMNEVLKRKI